MEGHDSLWPCLRFPAYEFMPAAKITNSDTKGSKTHMAIRGTLFYFIFAHFFGRTSRLKFAKVDDSETKIFVMTYRMAIKRY